MKLKLDENLPHDLANELSLRGHDVHTVVEEHLTGERDPVVVAAASGEGRMLLTLDRGMGDLRRYPPGSHTGIVVLRPVAQDPEPSSPWSGAWRERTRSRTFADVWSLSNHVGSGSGGPKRKTPAILTTFRAQHVHPTTRNHCERDVRYAPPMKHRRRELPGHIMPTDSYHLVEDGVVV